MKMTIKGNCTIAFSYYRNIASLELRIKLQRFTGTNKIK